MVHNIGKQQTSSLHSSTDHAIHLHTLLSHAVISKSSNQPLSTTFPPTKSVRRQKVFGCINQFGFPAVTPTFPSGNESEQMRFENWSRAAYNVIWFRLMLEK